jgi:ribosomal protein S17E
MGRVRTKTVKRSARVIVERFYSKLALDFDTNKRVRLLCRCCAALPARAQRGLDGLRGPSHLPLRPPPCRTQVTDDVALVPSKRMRNKIAGFVTVREQRPAAWRRAASHRAGRAAALSR